MNAPSDNSILSHALGLAERGFYVFPIKARTKDSPLVKFKEEATREAAKIIAWFDRGGDVPNIGIYTGKFGDNGEALLAIDIDNKNGKDGDATIRVLDLVEGHDFPLTYTQETPSGGWHLVYRVPDAVKQGVDVLGSGLDIRSRGGYIVGAGSQLVKGAYAGNDAEVAQAPKWLIERSNRMAEVRSTDARTVPSWADDEQCIADATEFLREYPPAIQGSAGDAHTVQMFMRLGDLGITPAKAVELAQDWNATCSPPWDLGDFQIKANSAFNSRLNPFGCAGSRYLLEPTTTAVHYPTTPISAEEAFQELRETPWFYDAAEFVSARQYKEELEEQYLKAERTKQYQQAIRAAQQFSVIIEDWWKIPILPAIDIPAVVHKEIHAKVGQRYPLVLTKAPKLQIRATAGLGKTTVVVEQVQRTDMRGKVIWILEPTHKKAIEIAKEIPGATVVYGRSSQNADGTAMCARQDLVHAIHQAGLPVQKTACLDTETDRACPHFETCPYQDQYRYLDALRAFRGSGVFVMAHQYLYVPCDAPSPDLMIIDESVVNTMKARFEIDISELCVPRTGLFPETSDTLRKVHEALWAIATLTKLRELGVTANTLENARTDLNGAVHQHRAVINPETDEQQAILILNRRESTVITNMARLCKALAAEIDLPRGSCHAVEVRQQNKGPSKIFVHYLREVRHKSAPHLLIDASADLDINRRLFGDELRELRLDVERRALVVQTRGRDFGNQSLTGKRKNERPHYPEQAERLRREVARVCKFLGMTLVIANKSAKESLAPHLEQVAETAHFGALRGLNAFKDHDAGAVVGREQPGPADAEGYARAYHATDPEPLILGVEGYAEEVRGHRMADGTAVPVTVQVHPDPRVQKFLEQIREREGEQAVDRMRTVWAERQKRILVLSNVVYDLDVGYCPTWESLIKMVQRFESASGVPVLIMSRRGLVQSAPAVWTPDKARADLEVMQGVGYLPSRDGQTAQDVGPSANSKYYLLSAPTPPGRVPVEYKLAAGGDFQLAWLQAGISDQRAAVERTVGQPVAEFRELQLEEQVVSSNPHDTTSPATTS